MPTAHTGKGAKPRPRAIKKARPAKKRTSVTSKIVDIITLVRRAAAVHLEINFPEWECCSGFTDDELRQLANGTFPDERIRSELLVATVEHIFNYLHFCGMVWDICDIANLKYEACLTRTPERLAIIQQQFDDSELSRLHALTTMLASEPDPQNDDGDLAKVDNE